jgi:hypothetical protein
MDPIVYLNLLVFLPLLLFVVNFLSFTHPTTTIMSPCRKSTARKSPGGTSPRLQIAVRLRMLPTVLRLRRIEPPPNPGSILLKSGDILGRTPYGALYHPRDDDVIDCGITSENAGDQIPNHPLRVLNVSTTFIELAFVNVRIKNLPFCIYLHPGDFLDLGDDNRFEVIDPMYEDDNDEDDDEDNDDEDDDNEVEANDAERDRKGVVADEFKEEEEVNNPSLFPNRHDEEEEEEEEEQLTPKTSKVDVNPNAAYAPKISTDDDDPNAAHSPIVRGRKDPYKMMRLFQKGKDPASILSREAVNEEVPPPSSCLSHNEEVNKDVPPSAFMPIAPVKVPRFAKRPKKRQR